MSGGGFGDVWNAISGTFDDMHKNFSANAQQIENANEAYNALRMEEKKFGLSEEEFDLTKLLAMQQYRDAESKRKWKADFARALAGINTTTR